MAQGTDIQFFGKSKVLEAYRARGINAWSIWQGKDLNFAGCTETELATYLDMLNGSQGRYQLRVHSAVEETDDIDNTTPFQGSFRFKLDGSPGAQVSGVAVQSPGGIGGVLGAINSRIESKIAAKFEKILDRLDEDEEDEKFTVGGFLNSMAAGVMKDPAQLPGLINAIRGIFSGVSPMMAAAPVMGTVSRVGAPAPSAVMTEDEEMERLAAAYNTLKRADPVILNHLEKLAAVSISNPQMFALMITSLNNLK